MQDVMTHAREKKTRRSQKKRFGQGHGSRNRPKNTRISSEKAIGPKRRAGALKNRRRMCKRGEDRKKSSTQVLSFGEEW